MIQYSTIRIAGQWLTSGGTSSGTPYITEITGLDKLRLNRQSNAFQAIDGTTYKQFHSDIGLPVSIRFPLIDTTTFNSIIQIINGADNSGTKIPLYISGPMGTFSMNVIPNGFETQGNAIAAGIQNVTFHFIYAEGQNILVASAGSLILTGASITG
jgi:hypothetical protein